MPLESPGPVEFVSTETMGNIFGIHALADGRVFVNDAIRKRLLLFDSTLASATVIAGGPGAPNPYGSVPIVLVPGRDDTTLVLDAESVSFLVYDPGGKVARVMSLPKPSDAQIIMAYTGIASLDAQGRLVYRGVLPARPPVAVKPGEPYMASPPPDSAPILRGHFDTRTVDTIGMVGIAVFKTRTHADSTGRLVRTTVYDPLYRSDDWAVTSDGTVALVRSVDYHIDWVRPDGTRYSTPKMPFDWRRYSESEKVALIDSMRTAMERNFRARMAAANNTKAVMPTMEFVSPNDMSDYPSTIKSGSVQADRDGNVWIPPTTTVDAAPGRLVYDVVNTRGEVTRRVQLPVGRRLVGFGPHGVLYYSVSDSAGARLERARIH